MQNWESGSLRATRRAARDINEMWNLLLVTLAGGRLMRRQWAWQYLEEKAMVLVTQLMEGLWQRSHGFPTIKFHPASFVTWKVSSSTCWSMASFKLHVCCKESVFSPISYHVISAYILTFTPFSQRYNCVMTWLSKYEQFSGFLSLYESSCILGWSLGFMLLSRRQLTLLMTFLLFLYDSMYCS